MCTSLCTSNPRNDIKAYKQAIHNMLNGQARNLHHTNFLKQMASDLLTTSDGGHCF
jgi:hypothetical protein